MNNHEFLESRIKQQGNLILKTLTKDCADLEDGSYYLCGLTQDIMRMLYSIISRNMPAQEAKATFKIAIDAVLISHGMSVNIHEFN
jgi:hypothetical protein